MKWMNLCLYGTPQAYILTNRSNVRSLKKKQQNYCIWDFVCEICWGRISLGPANRSNSKIVLCNISQFLSTCTLFSFSTFRCVQESCLFPSLCFLCIKSIFDFFFVMRIVHSFQTTKTKFIFLKPEKKTNTILWLLCVCMLFSLVDSFFPALQFSKNLYSNEMVQLFYFFVCSFVQDFSMETCKRK